MKGAAASKPMALSDQPSAFTAKPIRNGMFPSVSVSMGTLKHDSIVQYFSERSSSLLRKTFTFARDFSHEPAAGASSGTLQRKCLHTQTTHFYPASRIFKE